MGLLSITGTPACSSAPDLPDQSSPGADAQPVNPFRDLPAVPLDGREHPLPSTIAPLGFLNEDDVVAVQVSGEGIDAALIMAEDDVFIEAGRIAAGGPANEIFQYRVQAAGRYFVFVLFGPQVAVTEQRATLRVMPGDPDFAPPSRQVVHVRFDENFLTDPGLFDPVSGTAEERRLLESITASVRDGVVSRLEAIFAGTPIVILTQDDALPNEPISVLTFLAERKVGQADELLFDSAESVGAEAPQCADVVVFGEVLSAVHGVDPGNQNPADQAVVYVGSFQGRGAACRTAATNSVNNIVLGLSQTAAHEIGHMVGLYHVTLTDVMQRSPSSAFQRELPFGRGQMLVETFGDGQVIPLVLTNVIQDPEFFWRANFTN